MQLCECCTGYDACQLDKRKKGDPFASCESFERTDTISQDRYEAIKKQILRVRDEAKPKEEEKPPIVYNLNIPLEVSSNEFPQGALIDFLRSDLNNEAQQAAFIAQYFGPYISQAEMRNALILRLPDQLRQAQKSLRAFLRRETGLPSLLEEINDRLRHVQIRLVVDETVKGQEPFVRAKTELRGLLPGTLTQGLAPIGILYLQLAEWLVTGQEIRY